MGCRRRGRCRHKQFFQFWPSIAWTTPSSDDQRRRHVEPRADRREPVPAPLDLRRRRGALVEKVGRHRLRQVVQPRAGDRTPWARSTRPAVVRLPNPLPSAAAGHHARRQSRRLRSVAEGDARHPGRARHRSRHRSSTGSVVVEVDGEPVAEVAGGRAVGEQAAVVDGSGPRRLGRRPRARLPACLRRCADAVRAALAGAASRTEYADSPTMARWTRSAKQVTLTAEELAALVGDRPRADRPAHRELASSPGRGRAATRPATPIASGSSTASRPPARRSTRSAPKTPA